MATLKNKSLRGPLYGFLVFAAALTIRLGYLSGIDHSPDYDVRLQQGSDNYTYFVWGLSVAEGDLVGRGPFKLSPLYPYFLAVIFKIIGGGNLLIPRLVQIVLGSLTAVLAFIMARRLRGDLAGVLAGLLYAAYGPAIMYEAAFLRDGLLAILYLSLVLNLIAGRQRPGLGRGLLIGALFGLSILGKPTIAIMLAILPWWAWKARPSSRGTGEPKTAADQPANGEPRRPSAWSQLLAGCVIGYLIVIAPLVARNLAAGVAPLLSTQSGALEFIAGNHPANPYTGLVISPEVTQIEKDNRDRLFPSIIAVLKLYRDRPQALVRRELGKTWAFLNGYEVPNNLNYYVEKRYVAFLRAPWLTWPVILGPGVVGLWLMRRKWREWFELYAYIILLALGIIAFFVIDRFRLPLVPALAVFSGAGIAQIVSLLAAGKWKPALAALVVAAAIAIAVWPRVPDPLTPGDYQNQVRFHLLKKEPTLARAWADEGIAKSETIAADRDDAYSHYCLARLRFLAGDPLPQVSREIDLARQKNPPLWLFSLLENITQAVQNSALHNDPKIQGFRL